MAGWKNWLAAAIISVAWSTAGLAAERMSPPGSRIAIVPPPGFDLSKSFSGFEDRSTGSSIVLIELPAMALARIRENFTAELLATRRMTMTSRVTIKTATLVGLLVRATQPVQGQTIQK